MNKAHLSGNSAIFRLLCNQKIQKGLHFTSPKVNFVLNSYNYNDIKTFSYYDIDNWCQRNRTIYSQSSKHSIQAFKAHSESYFFQNLNGKSINQINFMITIFFRQKQERILRKFYEGNYNEPQITNTVCGHFVILGFLKKGEGRFPVSPSLLRCGTKTL